MTEPSHLHETRASYDTVAVDYAELVRPAFEGDLLGRAMLGAFAELVRAAGGGPVADVGCGPGHVTAHLHSLGLPAFGVELSPGMVEVARRDHPGLRFDVGTMTALELADGELDGVVAWYSIIHTPPEVLPTVFEEFHRVLAPGGHLLVFEGVNDIGTADASEAAQKQVADDLIAAYDQIAVRAHTQGIRVYGATLTPFGGNTAYDDPAGYREKARQTVNEWIRTSGRFDSVIDFDRVARDPQKPGQILAAYDDGDHLHLNPSGYRALADAVPSWLFRQEPLPRDFGFN